MKMRPGIAAFIAAPAMALVLALGLACAVPAAAQQPRAPSPVEVDADDLALDTFVAAWENLEQFKPEAAFRPWLHGIAYPSEQALEDDKVYFLKKMGWTAAQLEDYLKRPARPHSDFGSEARFFEFCIGLRDRLRG